MENEIDRTLAAGSAFDAYYGLRLVACDDEGARGTLDVAAHHLQPTGVVHGGVYACIAEALASFGTNWHVVGGGRIALGMHNATSFLRPCSGGTLHGVARPLYRGRTTWVWDVDLRDDAGALCASGRVTIAVRPRPEEAETP